MFPIYALPFGTTKKRKIVCHHPHAFGKLVHWLFISSDVYAAVLVRYVDRCEHKLYKSCETKHRFKFVGR